MPKPPAARVTVPARSAYGRVLGVVADAVAAEAGFDADRIDDLDLAVDEVATLLAGLRGAARLSLAVHVDGPTLRCDLAAAGEVDEAIELDDLRTRVLAAVTDAIELDPTRPRVGLLIGAS